MPTPAEVLRTAADLVGDGWCQHRSSELRDGKVYRCASGAIYAASGDDYYAAFRAAMAVRRYLAPARDIPDWNDAPGRTQAEVVAGLLAAAELAEREAA